MALPCAQSRLLPARKTVLDMQRALVTITLCGRDDRSRAHERLAWDANMAQLPLAHKPPAHQALSN